MDANRQRFSSALRGESPRVIVTRPVSDASTFADMVAAAGMVPVLSPAMEIVFQPQPVSFDGVRAVIFTSANGVRALQRAVIPAAIPALPAFAVGSASAEAARAAGFREVIAAKGDVASLAALIGSYGLRGTALHVGGRDLAGDLAGILSAAGVEARRIALYVTEPVARLSAAAEAMLAAPSPKDWATFFSPRTVRLFIEQARASGVTDGLGSLRAACLSGAVAEAAANVSWAGLKVAAEPSAEAMIDAMLEANIPARS
ncbi:MAG: uroporphyrinogen-III synthase [Pseudomonadota bacterium]|nr:uroporphyrinogen-III synthase [Pseudomonadota bacterium]